MRSKCGPKSPAEEHVRAIRRRTRRVRYQSAAKAFASAQLSLLVEARRLMPSRKVAHCQFGAPVLFLMWALPPSSAEGPSLG